MDKFGRAYALNVQSPDGPIPPITLPFTIEFDITRNTLTSKNVCQVRIFNLGLRNRNMIRQNSFDTNIFRSMTLQAGYGKNLATIFSGHISTAGSVRQGVDFITTIECYDAGFAFLNGVTDITFPAGQTPRSIISTLAATMPNTSLGYIGLYPGPVTTRASTYSGNTGQILDALTGGGMFIDNGKTNALATTEVIPGPPLVINSQTGLLGTPIVERTWCRFDMIFEPTLNVGQTVVLASSTANNYNGSYKVTGVKHRGMISEAVCGVVITTVELLLLAV